MPPKKTKASKKCVRNSEEDGNSCISMLDVQYNPDIVNGLIEDLGVQVENKCNQIQKDCDFMKTSFEQAFKLELIKIPTQVKQMSLKKFKEEYNFSLDAVRQGAVNGIGKAKETSSSSHIRSSNLSVFQTPSHSGRSQSARPPIEGETILSSNGSPLGEFQTAVKAPKLDAGIIPPTPGIFVPLDNGEVLDVSSMNVDSLPADVKEDAVSKMQEMMKSMQSLIDKLGV